MPEEGQRGREKQLLLREVNERSCRDRDGLGCESLHQPDLTQRSRTCWEWGRAAESGRASVERGRKESLEY